MEIQTTIFRSEKYFWSGLVNPNLKIFRGKIMWLEKWKPRPPCTALQSPIPQYGLRRMKPILVGFNEPQLCNERQDLNYWSGVSHHHFSPPKPPRIPDTSIRTTENYGRKNGGILLVGIIETQLKINSQQGSPRLTKGHPKPIINPKRQHQKTTISAQRI